MDSLFVLIGFATRHRVFMAQELQQLRSNAGFVWVGINRSGDSRSETADQQRRVLTDERS